MYDSHKLSRVAPLSEHPTAGFFMPLGVVDRRTRQPNVARLVRIFATACRRAFEGWRERARDRRELSQMSPRDFGDVTISPGLLREETSRWPWQGASPGWCAIRDDGRAAASRRPFRGVSN